ncbi:hypothetical protein ACIP5Y_23945 [Nocardia sp. NPDC088792]|uniref:hypothetical protein n=1 Tax=Nocardia sp. NPDC088792 TaxID=3364332 RepID=UPI00382AB9DA
MVNAATAAAAAITVLVGAGVVIIDDVGPATADTAAPDPNCTLIVPDDPLSARGLATPYQLVATDAAAGPCNEADVNQSAFVEAAILSGDGKLSTYDPLVIDQGTRPAAQTVPARVEPGSTVAIWFGFNGTALTLKSSGNGDALADAHCVNGLPAGTIFGQFAYCNAVKFFQDANRRITGHTLAVPANGTAKDGLPCPTTRDFSVVDQDQSDNVVTHYLATANGQTAQNNPANQAKLTNTTDLRNLPRHRRKPPAPTTTPVVDLANGSDNLLLSEFIDPALGCTPFTAPDQSSGDQASAALSLDELSAAANQQAPIALVPLNDPMTLDNGANSPDKTNLYRQGVDQSALGGADNGDGATYCTNIFTNAAGIQRVFQDQAFFAAAPSVDPAMATNLFTFLAVRAQQSFGNLNCQALTALTNPITLTTDNNGVVTAATFTAAGTPTSTTPIDPTTTDTTTTDPITTTDPTTATAPATTTDPTTTADPTITTASTIPTTSTVPTIPTTSAPPITTAPMRSIPVPTRHRHH